MRILISGSSGLIGLAVAQTLAEQGHTVSRLLRPQTRAAAIDGDVRWDPYSGDFDSQAAEGADAVIHLAGASIGEGRWTDERKTVLRTSRVEATKHLVASLAALSSCPRIFICASAVGYFGDRGDEKLTDHAGPGNDFLAKLCCDWEQEAGHAAEFGARVVMLRFGIVLSTRGGALPRMLTPIKMFVGGRIGSGKQWMSWITLADVVGAVQFALENKFATGAFNCVSPEPVRNSEFIKTTARVLQRPAIFPAPAFALRLMLGEMADALLLSSQRAVPDKLQLLGYEFGDPELGNALGKIISEGK
ncbi:MAG TPA: TIGR01777 family oxidoreductase [Candidatus Acidoferrum sp.]|nr:TIGR01777 family oxidoreductase [Candidatus Acidoferrum sp.]